LTEASENASQALGDTLYERVAKGVLGVVGTVASATKKADTLGYEQVKHLSITLQSKRTTIQEKIALLEQELTEKEEQINKAGLFQVSLKDTLKKEIKKTQEKITTMNNELIDIEEKIRIVLEVIEPVETRVKEYTTELDRITEKYYILNLK
jgi:uncharacterized coiled-coil DUF342 family protein